MPQIYCIISLYHLGKVKISMKKIYTSIDIGSDSIKIVTAEYYNKKIYVAPRQEINLGDATILSNIDGKLKEYSVEIQRIYLNNNYDNKSMVIKIKDENLINKTGGIVQGMSGSPIIQNGKFIGAITHVFVKDPTLGYAVFADRMISELHT